MTHTIKELQDVIDTCEFDRWLGLTVEAVSEDSVTLSMPQRREILGTPKVERLHGGAVGSLIDAAGCYVLIARLNRRLSTISLVVDYLRPAHGTMVALARIVKLGRRICTTSVEVTGSDGKLVATGRLTVVLSDVEVGQEHKVERIA
ncbi:PaaI family thioesterase [Oceanicola sp. 502str15]|uniref:PaaI family thioesterase n=1 Tax=Oceanicola sp. 502str15 TaxID=2696061 RepID=UPI0020942E5C|nr:PaaI family thioesterase [Oceanicola sp. 502str15]MCO6381739.1 hotdog fold thioesterase [Oceanicola sp. 502str15]